MAEPKLEATITAPTASYASAGNGAKAAPPSSRRPRDENPMLAYLARLSLGSRRASLEIIARLAPAGEVGALEFPWWLLRYQHADAIRGTFAEAYSPAAANKMLSAMKGVLKSCWCLGLMTADERGRASDVEPGRSIQCRELRSSHLMISSGL